MIKIKIKKMLNNFIIIKRFYSIQIINSVEEIVINYR